MYRNATVWITTPKQMPPGIDERVQLTVEEMRFEQARRLSMLLGVPTRVWGDKIEALLGDVWVQQRDELLST